MNILILSHLYPSPGLPHSGTFVEQQAKYLARMNHNITIVCPVPLMPKKLSFFKERYGHHQTYSKFTNDEGISVYYIRTPMIPRKMLWARGILHYFFHKHFFKKLHRREKFDVIHCHVMLPSGQLGVLLKEKLKIPAIVTVHGADFQIYIDNSRNLKAIRYVSSKIDRITCVSEKLAKIYKQKVETENTLSNVQVIPNGFEVYSHYAAVDDCKNEKIKILTIASLRKQKNLKHIIDVVNKLQPKFPAIEYTIIGDGWDRNFYEEYLNKISNPPFIRLVGYLPHKIAMDYLNSSDIFILTSTEEAFGIVYLEAMYLKKITIGSSSEGIKEIILPGENGYLVDPFSEDDLSHTLEFILENIDHLDHIRNSANKTVWPRYSWLKNALTYTTIFYEVANE